MITIKLKLAYTWSIWYKNGEIHRDNDLPAIIYSDGYKVWYVNGRLIKNSFS